MVVPDHKLYFAEAASLDEAHYLCAFLNSHPVRTWLGGFLLGKQIGTTIFEYMHVPAFDPTNADHRRLAALSAAAHSRRRGKRNNDPLADEIEDELREVVRRVAGRTTA